MRLYGALCSIPFDMHMNSRLTPPQGSKVCECVHMFACRCIVNTGTLKVIMDNRIQVKLDKYQKCGNIISQTSLHTNT